MNIYKDIMRHQWVAAYGLILLGALSTLELSAGVGRRHQEPAVTELEKLVETLKPKGKSGLTAEDRAKLAEVFYAAHHGKPGAKFGERVTRAQQARVEKILAKLGYTPQELYGITAGATVKRAVVRPEEDVWTDIENHIGLLAAASARADLEAWIKLAESLADEYEKLPNQQAGQLDRLRTRIKDAKAKLAKPEKVVRTESQIGLDIEAHLGKLDAAVAADQLDAWIAGARLLAAEYAALDARQQLGGVLERLQRRITQAEKTAKEGKESPSKDFAALVKAYENIINTARESDSPAMVKLDDDLKKAGAAVDAWVATAGKTGVAKEKIADAKALLKLRGLIEAFLNRRQYVYNNAANLPNVSSLAHIPFNVTNATTEAYRLQGMFQRHFNTLHSIWDQLRDKGVTEDVLRKILTDPQFDADLSEADRTLLRGVVSGRLAGFKAKPTAAQRIQQIKDTNNRLKDAIDGGRVPSELIYDAQRLLNDVQGEKPKGADAVTGVLEKLLIQAKKLEVTVEPLVPRKGGAPAPSPAPDGGVVAAVAEFNSMSNAQAKKRLEDLTDALNDEKYDLIEVADAIAKEGVKKPSLKDLAETLVETVKAARKAKGS